MSRKTVNTFPTEIIHNGIANFRDFTIIPIIFHWRIFVWSSSEYLLQFRAFVLVAVPAVHPVHHIFGKFQEQQLSFLDPSVKWSRSDEERNNLIDLSSHHLFIYFQYFPKTLITWAAYCLTTTLTITVLKILNMHLHSVYDKAQTSETNLKNPSSSKDIGV